MRHIKLSFCSPFCLLVLICKISVLQSQVLVHEEPRHRPVFHNNEIRILDVLIPPGDTTQFHIHHTPSVFINFTSTNTGSQLHGKEAVRNRSTAGRILFENLAAPNTRTHRVWNLDKDTFHVIDVELLYEAPGFADAPLSMPGLKLETDTAWVRAYRLTLEKGKEFMLNNKKQAWLLVSLSASGIETKQGEKLQQQTIKAGSFFNIKRGQSFSVRNINEEPVQFVLLEFPVGSQID